MKRNIIFLSLLVVFFLAYWVGKTFYYEGIPDKIVDLEEEQRIVNEKFITAQILSQSLNRVYKIFENNLEIKTNGEMSQAASMPFLNNLTDIMNELDIKILELKPKTQETQGTTILVPYELIFECTYENLGNFVTELERNDRLINIDEFYVDNGIDRLTTMTNANQLVNLRVNMILSVVTIKKARS